MAIGVELSNDDLEAVRVLYRERWTAEIHTWKERGTDYCLWFVSCPDHTGQFVTETGHSLAATIKRILHKVHVTSLSKD